MKWTTPVSFEPTGPQVDRSSSLLSVGSCFSENIGHRLRLGGVPIQVNPFGVSYNIESILNQLHQLGDGVLQTSDRWFSYNNLWHSKDHHGSFSRPTRDELEAEITRRQLEVHPIKKDITHIFITPGTAYKWVEKSTGQTVNNCHKRPGSDFSLELIKIENILRDFEKVYALWPKAQFWFSISPVRHLKQGAVNNQKSKATLVLAISEIVEKYERAYYFPAYEIVVDELRDYRFYDRDLVHPSPDAIDEIWERFSVLLSTDTQNMIKASEKVRNLFNHRVLHPTPESIEKHNQLVTDKISQWEGEFKREWIRE
jgi:hypothetical protein